MCPWSPYVPAGAPALATASVTRAWRRSHDVVTTRELAIVRSVVYASLFDSPLTPDQMHHSLVESDQTP